MLKQRIKKLANRFGLEVGRLPKHSIRNYQDDDFRRLGENYSKMKPLKLHFGCGPRVLKGWANIDLHFTKYDEGLHRYGPMYSPEIRGDISDFYAINVIEMGLPLADDSADIIFHEDFIEHLNQRDQIIFLTETCRVLKRGGAIHRINTPNLVATMRGQKNKHLGRKGLNLEEWDRWEHLNVLTPTTLKEMALMCGYSDVHFNVKDKSESPLAPPEFRPGDLRPDADGNLFADLIK